MIFCRDCERNVEEVAAVYSGTEQICPWCGGDVKELPEDES